MARGAEAALRPVALRHALLDRVEGVAFGADSFDCGDAHAVAGEHWAEASVDAAMVPAGSRPPSHHDVASAAAALCAGRLGASVARVLAQVLQERKAGITDGV